MNNYMQLSFKFLIKQKSRTILTIFGVAISVALITSIWMLFYSTWRVEINNTIKETGPYHIKVTNANANVIKSVKSIKGIEKVTLEGFYVPEIELNSKYRVGITKSDLSGFVFEKKVLLSGKLPSEKFECLIPGWVSDELGYKIGDKIGIKNKEGTYDLKVTGTYEEKENKKLDFIVIYEYVDDALADKNINGSSINISIKSGFGFGETLRNIENLASGVGLEVTLNEELLSLNGYGDKTSEKTILIIAAFGFGLLVMLAGSVVVYNSFHISVLERIKLFGMLRTIGTTPGQLKIIVILEALIIATIAIPLGIATGILGIKMMFGVMSGFNKLFSADDVYISTAIIIITIIFCFLEVLISAVLPAFTASKASPMEVLLNRTKNESAKINNKTGVLYNHLPIEYKMASKGIHSNKKRLNLTIASIAISVMLLIVACNLLSTLFDINALPDNEEANISYKTVFMDTIDENTIKESISYLENSEVIDNEFLSYSGEVSNALINNNQLSKRFLNIAGESIQKINSGNDQYSCIPVNIIPYTDLRLKECKKYIESGDIDLNRLETGETALVVLNVNCTDKDGKNAFRDKIADLKIGDKLFVDINGYRKVGNDNTGLSFKIGAILKENPYGKAINNNSITIIISDKAIQKIVQKVDLKAYKVSTSRDFSKFKPIGIDIIAKPAINTGETFTNLEEYFTMKSIGVTDLTNVNEKAKLERNRMILLAGFFIGIIGIIGLVNLVNSIISNILLRRREFATIAAIGMTKGQLAQMLLAEASIYGLFGGLIGIIFGELITYFFMVFNEAQIGKKWVPDVYVPIAALLVTIFLCLVVTIIPIKRVLRASIIEDIRQE